MGDYHCVIQGGSGYFKQFLECMKIASFLNLLSHVSRGIISTQFFFTAFTKCDCVIKISLFRNKWNSVPRSSSEACTGSREYFIHPSINLLNCSSNLESLGPGVNPSCQRVRGRITLDRAPVHHMATLERHESTRSQLAIGVEGGI